MEQNNIIESGGFYFIHNFDSGNLGHVERVPTELIAPSIINQKTNTVEVPDYEFNLWTRPDCAGTEFENGNRTWFYFGVQASEANILVRLNLINLNKQGKMYNQGMAPVTRTLPGKPQWERIRDRPVHSTDDNTFTLSFKYRTSENLKATTFFAFTYPFSFAELQIALNSIDMKMLPIPTPLSLDDIYYCRECLVYSLEGRRVDLLTISSHHGIKTEREDRLRYLFPDNSQERPFKFHNKKVIFISARVHPGETPSSFVFNGFLNLLLTRNDPIAIQLRKHYVFKMIPFLNPDGVARGHYRTDTRGVNLNRVYLNPSLAHHPTIYASRALIRYYHYGCEKEDIIDESKSFTSRSIQNISESAELLECKKKKSPNSSTTYKGGDYYKRDRQPNKNKSATNVKQTPNAEGSAKVGIKPLSTDAALLAEQVCDMRLQEKPSQTSDPGSKTSKTNVCESPSLLNDSVLKSCLGSNVHLSTSEELNFQGSNPLRPLRDTLKNSISLLMESNSSGTAMVPKDSRLTNLKMGWCKECRQSVYRIEDTMPGLANGLPGYKDMVRSQPTDVTPPTYHSIEEYREHQRLQLAEDALQKAQELEKEQEKEDTVYFCTNCFKRYVISAMSEEIKLCETTSHASASLSTGDDGDGDYKDYEPLKDTTGGSTGDNPTPEVSIIKPTPPASPPKEEKEKPKTPPRGQRKKAPAPPTPKPPQPKESDSGLYLYIDLHGHASKKGIFMYGNHFDDLESSVECMLLPRVMSLNNLHFHFSSCNFTERNMYLKDRRDGMSREGSGRVAVLKATGLVRSYTLECNYNTGRLVNALPPGARDPPPASGSQGAGGPPAFAALPPKYTPHIYEEVRPYAYRPKNLEVFEDMDPNEVGRSLGASILDLIGQHPNSRIPCSEHKNLTAIRDWLRIHNKSMRPSLAMSRLRPKTLSPTRAPQYTRSKAKVTDERKENTFIIATAKTELERKRSPVLVQRSGHDIINVNMKFTRKVEPVKTPSRTKYLVENEPKPKSLTTKRRNILAIRKPNSSKIQISSSGTNKSKIGRRSVDDTENPRSSIQKLSKRSYSRGVRGALRSSSNRCRAMASSSSEDVASGGWEHVAGGTALASLAPRDPRDPDSLKRRVYPAPAPTSTHLKKIRLKTAL